LDLLSYEPFKKLIVKFENKSIRNKSWFCDVSLGMTKIDII